MTRLAVSALALLTAAGLCHAQKKTESDARADAKAESTGGKTQTSTHRVVVKNGKVVVDEKTVNGKKVPSCGGAGLPPGGIDPEEMLRRMREKMGKNIPPIDLPKLRSGKLGGKQVSTHKVRRVVRNGEVVVDEETRDGKPVRSAGAERNEKARTGGLGEDRSRKLESRKKRRAAEAKHHR